MDKNKKNKNTKKTWIQYGIFAVVAITLYATGLHTEVIGFAQRGLLATGLMNPDIEEIAQVRNIENNEDTTAMLSLTKATLDLKLMDADGKTRSLKEFKGKVIFLNFWATWCPPCIAEMPSIDKLHERMGNEVAFILLSQDQDFNKAIEFNKQKEYDLPIYTPTGNIPKMYQSTAIPTTYIINVDGYLVLTHKGMADYDKDEFREFLKTQM